MSIKKTIFEILHGNGEKIVGYTLSAIMIVAIVWIFWKDTNFEMRCVGESKVVKILELKYRNADILLENGMVIDVSQASLKVGDPYCYDYKEFKVGE